jgi:trimethylamine corrinoid protein
MEEYVKRIYEAVLNYEVEPVKQRVIEALEHGIDPIAVMNEGLSRAIIEIGDKFGKEEIFLMELMIAAEACMSGMDIAKKKLLQSEVGTLKPKGVVVIGTVEGDIHNIGKDIVKTLLQTAGFEVHDIGVDQKAGNFAQKTREVDARIVASSALLTTTSPNQKAIEEKLKEAGIRDRVKTIIGGAATSEDWAREVGCDFYAPTATEGVNIIKKYFEGA